jgi:membrane protease YdiL (CAAX protease family)
MAAAESLRLNSARVEPVAPWRHTAVMSAIFLTIALWGAVWHGRLGPRDSQLAQAPDLMPLYLSLMIAQWGLFYYVWKGGLQRAGVGIGEIIGGRWAKPRDVLLDLALAAATWAVWMLGQVAWGKLFGHEDAASIRSLLPRRPIEVALWVALSLSAGFCEELSFRGYFLRQFRALTHRAWLALLLQAALFGISHSYQGAQACLKITVFGVLFGLLALWRRSLRPGMTAHALTDILAGIF